MRGLEIIYPKNVDENLQYRYEVMALCQRNEMYRDVVKGLFREDILFAFNVFFWTYDPRSEMKDLPFVTYGYQDEVILEVNRCIEEGEDIFGDKSRDMGLTYLVLYVPLWRWLTKRSEEYRLGSRKEDFVDKSGDMDSHFEKLRYMLKRLPKFLLPAGYRDGKHSTYARLVNPETNCSFIGEATNKDFGAGGRKNMILFDEFSRWEMAEESWRSASDATKCKIAISTPLGSANKFAELSRTKEVKNKIHLMWYLHPKKSWTSKEYLEGMREELHADQSLAKKYNDKYVGWEREMIGEGIFVDKSGKLRSEWYDKECLKRSKEDIAENLDCSYLSTGQPVFDTRICYQNQLRSKPPVKTGELIWKIRPVFNEEGYCSNLEQLKVEFIENGNGLYKIWEMPEKGWENGYIVSADCAEGLEQGDYDNAVVLKRFGEKEMVVCDLHGKLKPHEYGEELAKLGYFYEEAWVAPERQGSGQAVLTQLLSYYKKVYHKEVLAKGYPEITDKLGFDTGNRSIKQAIIGELSKHISLDLFTDYDEEFWKETITYVNNGGVLEAQGKRRGQKCYDDRVISRAIGIWINGNLPLPHRKVEKTEYVGWRKQYFERQPGIIGFAIR